MTESGGVVTLSGNSSEVFAYTIGGAATRAGNAVTASAGDLTNGTRVDASGYTAGTTDIVFSAASDTVTGSPRADTVTPVTGVTSSSDLKGGANVVIVTNGADIAAGTFSATGGSVGYNLDAAATGTLNATQAAAITSAAGVQNISLSNQAQGLTLNAAVETFILGDFANSVTLGAAAQNVSASGGNDSVALAALTATGSMALAAGTNHVTATVGGDISGATISAVGGTADLTLSGDGVETLSTAEYNLFNATGITFTGTAGAANATIVLSDAGTVTANANVYHYVLSAAGNAITLINGNDTVTGAAGNDSVDVAALKVTGAIDLGAGANHVAASSGAVLNAAITASGTADLTLAAGAGVTMSATNYTRFNAAGIAAAGTETITLSDALSGAQTLNSQVETFVLAAGDNSVTSGAADQTIDAGALAAGQTLTLAGTQRAAVALTTGNLTSISSGNLTVTATGNNTITTGSGDDVFDFSAAGVVFSSADTIAGGTGADTLKIGKVGATTALDGVTGVDTVRFADNASVSIVSSDALVASGQVLTVDASALTGTNPLTWNGSNESDGAFNIIAGSSTATLTGGAGDDTFDFTATGVVFSSADTIAGGAGTDTLKIGRVDTTTALDGVTGVDTVRFANNAAVSIVSSDALVASGQVLTVDASALTASHTFTWNGSNESDGAFKITAGSSNATITGGAGNDALITGSGTNRVDGGAGSDTITLLPGLGADTVVFSSLAAGAVDTINNFGWGADTIELIANTDGGRYITTAGNLVSAATTNAFAFTPGPIGSSSAVLTVLTNTISSDAALAASLATGGTNALTLGAASAGSDLLMLYSDGTNAHLVTVTLNTPATSFTSGELSVTDMATLVGVGPLAGWSSVHFSIG